MAYVSLYELLPELAIKETRTITVFPMYKRLPPGDYGLVEMYCADHDCDCRRVLFSVISSNTQKPVAVIAYGWESDDFYARWYNRGKPGPIEPETLADLKGPCLNWMSPQSQYANEVLRVVAGDTLRDKAYVDRLKRHYALFKKKLEESPEYETEY